MKNYYFILIITLLFCNCTNNDHAISKENLQQELVTEYYEYDKSLSNDCNICLLKDSIQEIKNTLHIAKIYELPLDSNLNTHKEELKKILEDWSAQTPENVALKACKKEYQFTTQLDSAERQQYLFQYVSYSFYTNTAFMEPNIDTSTFEKSNGNYVIEFRGQDVLISCKDFPNYWESVLKAYENVNTYINQKKDEAVRQITGKPTTQLTKIEKLMFLEHARTNNLKTFGNKEFLLNDKKFQELDKLYNQTILNN